MVGVTCSLKALLMYYFSLVAPMVQQYHKQPDRSPKLLKTKAVTYRVTTLESGIREIWADAHR